VSFFKSSASLQNSVHLSSTSFFYFSVLPPRDASQQSRLSPDPPPPPCLVPPPFDFFLRLALSPLLLGDRLNPQFRPRFFSCPGSHYFFSPIPPPLTHPESRSRVVVKTRFSLPQLQRNVELPSIIPKSFFSSGVFRVLSPLLPSRDSFVSCFSFRIGQFPLELPRRSGFEAHAFCGPTSLLCSCLTQAPLVDAAFALPSSSTTTHLRIYFFG